MGQSLEKEEDTFGGSAHTYIPYYSVFDIKETKQEIPLKKKNSYYTTVCKNYNSIKLHGIELLK